MQNSANKPDVIIGFDPGIGITGYGVLRVEESGDLTVLEYGVIRTPANTANPTRLLELSQKCEEILRAHKPTVAACEELFFTKNVTTGISVAQARGVILLSLAKYGLSVLELTPPQVKEAVTGYGAAEKSQVQYMTQNILRLKDLPKPDDAADALAVAIAAQQLARFA